MSYADALGLLHGMTPELFVEKGKEKRKFSLDELRILLHELGSPEKKFSSVLIAGTNGKGSTASTLASILDASGKKTGLYTSPHLERINERIRVGREEISDESFGRIFFQMRAVAEKLVTEGKLSHLPSFFESLTVMAFLYFQECDVEIAVLEVGMGGRLDATNVVEPLVSVITDISLDHTEWLGSTIAEIAREKAGILRANGVMITLPQLPEANLALGEVALSLGVDAISASEYMPPMEASANYFVEALGSPLHVQSSLHGSHQHRNVALAIASAVALVQKHGFLISVRSMEEGIHNNRWPGRLEEIHCCGKRWILDVAHNPAGAWALRSGWKQIADPGQPATLLFSCLRDKPADEMARILFPEFSQVVLAPIHSLRASSLELLQNAALQAGVTPVVAPSVADAIRKFVEENETKVIVVSGSVYLVGEVRALLTHMEEEKR